MSKTFIDHAGRRQVSRRERDEIEVWRYRCGFTAVCILWVVVLVFASGIL